MSSRHQSSALFSVAACVAVFLLNCDSVRAQEKVARIVMHANELRSAGIAVQQPGIAPLPNSCRVAGNAELSVADKMLSHFKRRGFSLESLCLALSSAVRFDPETGKQLPVAVDARDRAGKEWALNFPDCFKGGNAYLDCKIRYDRYEGIKLDRKDLEDGQKYHIEADRRFRDYVKRRRISGVFKNTDAGDTSSLFLWILASDSLPRGYGYALAGPEGDDPGVEDVDLRTYKSRSKWWSLWSDTR